MQEWEEERRVARRERIVVGGEDAKLGAQLAVVSSLVDALANLLWSQDRIDKERPLVGPSPRSRETLVSWVGEDIWISTMYRFKEGLALVGLALENLG